MKLVRFGPKGREKPGIIDKAGIIRDLSRVVPDITPETLADGAIAKIKKAKIANLPAAPKNAPRFARWQCPALHRHRAELRRSC